MEALEKVERVSEQPGEEIAAGQERERREGLAEGGAGKPGEEIPVLYGRCGGRTQSSPSAVVISRAGSKNFGNNGPAKTPL